MLDLRSGGVKLRGVGFRGGLTVVEGVAVDGGGVRGGRLSPLSPRSAIVRETLAARSSTYKTTR